MAVARSTNTTITVDEVETGHLDLAVLGTRPLICNRMAEKARRELLLGGTGRKTTADKAATLKHDPLAEFRASPYLLPAGPALIGVMASAFKGAMMTAALDMPGTRKAQIGRLVYVEGDYVPVYGIPRLMMAVTRSADIAHTPDIRTRAVLLTWAAIVTVTFVAPIMTPRAVANLLAAGGLTAGIGDWRPEKGKGNFGQFRLTTLDDPAFAELIATGGRAAQEAAMDDPEFYDAETAELFAWFGGEADRRGKIRTVA